MGLLVSKYGVGPREEKVRAALEANRPSTPTEVTSFLCMVGFSARFVPNLAAVSEPLRAISRKGVPFVWSSEQDKSFKELKKQLASAPVLAYFVWSSEQDKSFKELKKQLASAPVLAYFDKDAHTRVIADASPVGLGAVLVQEKNG